MQTFTKAERLCSKILIDELVEKGKSFNNAPLRVTWLEVTDSTAPAQIMISVPKRSFKKAVDRNRLKRLIREGYRKNKQELYTSLNDKKIILLVVYTAKTIIEYKEMEGNIIDTLQRLTKAINP